MLSHVRALRDWAEARPDDPAVIGPDLELGAGELWDTALRIVGWLRASGVRDDEAVGAKVPPALHPVFLFALLARGGVGSLVTGDVEVGPHAPLQRLVTAGSAHRDAPPESVLRFDDTAIGRMAELDLSSITVAEPAPDEVCWLIHSSGTTGTPKAVMRTAAAMAALTPPRRLRLARSAYLSLQPGTVAGSMAAFLASITVRRPHLIAGEAEYNLEVLRDRRIEIAEGSPFQLDSLMTAARRAGERLPGLRELHSAGAPLSAELASALSTWFNVEVYDGYGSTETGFVATRRADVPGADERGGVVMDDVAVEIVDDDHHPVPAGEAGRVRLRTDNMGIGYAGAPDLGPYKGFHEGWFYPGDLGRLVDDELVILGREDELMNVGGQKILPQRVEEVVLRQPGIHEAVACAVTDRLGVRQLAIAVVGDPLSDPTEFARRLRRPLGGIQPSLIARVGSIPRTATGKLRRQEVADMLQRQLQGPGPVL